MTRAPGGRTWFLVAVVATLVNLPLVHSTVVDGAVAGSGVVVVTLVADAALVGMVLLARRYAAGLAPRQRLTALADVERSRAPAGLTDLGDGVWLAVGEVAGIEPHEVVLDLGDRSVVVVLDGYANPVGHQQPAQVRVRVD
ncbi:MAG: hypothetical protein ACXVWZ_09710 [Nocardioides sp.]